MKIRLATIALASLTIAACEQSPEAKIRSACVSSGETAEKCSCLAKEAVDNLPQDKLDAVLVLIDEDIPDREKVNRVMSQISITELPALGAFVERTARTCKLDSFSMSR